MESKALELDPLLSVNYANLAATYYIFRDYENAIRISNTALSMDLKSFVPAAVYPPLVWSYIETGRLDKAEEIANKVSPTEFFYVELKTNIAVARKDTNLVLTNLRQIADDRYARLAEFYLDLGMWDKAAINIEKAYRARQVGLVYYSKIRLPDDYADHPALKKAFDKPELKKLFELRRKNLSPQ
jgi:tetratricopeptide (TPR) repeat protein